MMIRRCGVPDVTNLTSSSKPTSSNHHKSKMFHMVSHYAFPEEIRRWPSSKYQLTYTFRSGVQNPNEADMRGDHGDRDAFDGPLGKVLAHAFYPQDGRFHYDADEDWSNNPNMNQFDLESVAAHEIGHLLGLAHSQDSNAIMFSIIPIGTIKRELIQDDIDGIHALYPN
ncbi:hypothetical protein GH714_034305 [Hevea brasiliensis]|uniref:Peptidase metallopeptidase domain-containing protein n=1 Tax=Hevea brasiliensis TaxID=3981 RepID=A0A6A6LT14_HEVBR|nr:hypothetical protein GH714_034305 [Hevea brasiliensis]